MDRPAIFVSHFGPPLRLKIHCAEMHFFREGWGRRTHRSCRSRPGSKSHPQHCASPRSCVHPRAIRPRFRKCIKTPFKRSLCGPGRPTAAPTAHIPPNSAKKVAPKRAKKHFLSLIAVPPRIWPSWCFCCGGVCLPLLPVCVLRINRRGTC